MQRDRAAFAGSPSFPYGHEADGCMANGPLAGECNYKAPASPALLGASSGMSNPQIRSPLGVFEFQPSEVCPRNFIIFDHTDDKGRIVYHPALVTKLSPATNANAFPSHGDVAWRSSGQDIIGNLEEEEEVSSSFKEDTEEIDALLSSDEESIESEDDVVSTGRTPDPLENDLFDSSSSSPSFRKARCFSGKSPVRLGSMENVTDEKVRKMVTVLRGIIPGAEHLDTPGVLEEAIRYLKFLKVEAEKLGVASLDLDT